MLQPKKPVKKYVPTAREKKNLKDATEMKNMRPTGPTTGRIKPTMGGAKSGKTISKAKNGKPIKKAFLGSLLGGAAGKSMLGGIGKQLLGGMGKQMLGGLAGGALSGLMGGKNGKTVKKSQNGSSLGMKSVKAGFDKNPGITRADIITAAKGKAKSGASMKKCKNGCK
jgi:hypothetical protein